MNFSKNKTLPTTRDGWIYFEIHKGVYGFLQYGKLAEKLLSKCLHKTGYYQAATTPGLWLHKWQHILFTIRGKHHQGLSLIRHHLTMSLIPYPAVPYYRRPYQPLSLYPHLIPPIPSYDHLQRPTGRHCQHKITVW